MLAFPSVRIFTIATVLCNYLTEELQKADVIVAEHANMKSETALKSESAKTIFEFKSNIKTKGSSQNIFIIKKGDELLWSTWYLNTQFEHVWDTLLIQATFMQNERKFSTSGINVTKQDQDYQMAQLMLCVFKVHFKNNKLFVVFSFNF